MYFSLQKVMAEYWWISILSVIELIKLCNTDTSNQDRIESSLNTRPSTRNNVQFIFLRIWFLNTNLINSSRKHLSLNTSNNEF